MFSSFPSPSFILRFPNSTATDIIANGLPEQSLIDWCRQFCNTEKVFVDIGAHVGMYALSLAPYCQSVHAFECQRETYYQLCGGVAVNSYWNVYPHHVALGASCKPDVPIHIVSLDGGGTTLDTDRPDTIEIQRVESKTLDSFNLQNVGFLKLDVEGAEENVLRGSMETLKRCNYPPFIFETWTDEKYRERRQSLFDFITQTLKYKIVPIYRYPHMMFATYPQ
jgi:FkbM family methyltransferase